MIDIRILRSEPDRIRRALERRHARFDLDDLLELDAKRRATLYELEQCRAEQNRASADIARTRKSGEDASAAIEAMRKVKEKIAALEQQVTEIDEALAQRMLSLPNIPDESVPDGASSEDNPVLRVWGEPRRFDFEPKDHVEIGRILGILDFDRAAKLSGARFSLSLGAGALLERALINFMLDLHTREHGYTEVLPPFMVNSDSMRSTGQLPKFAEDLFRIEGADLWLIPTAEVPVTNIHRDEILDADTLPLYYTAYTPCFRSEAGSYGKDTRGMIRQHQFNKVELVKFTRPEDSWMELEKLTANAEAVLQRLGLPYRVVTLCAGDLGFSAAKTYDLEVWLPGQNAYREISSCSNFTDFQARRASIRFRGAGGKPEFAHTLNGSGLAVGRTAVAILENYQEKDGSVTIPEALRPYMNGMERIEAR